MRRGSRNRRRTRSRPARARRRPAAGSSNSSRTRSAHSSTLSTRYPPTPSDAFAIEPGATYTLRYRARFEAGVAGALLPAVTVKIGHASPPYTPLVMFTGDTIATNYSTYTHVINSAAGDTGAGLVFNGTLDYFSEVCFDDVTLVKN